MTARLDSPRPMERWQKDTLKQIKGALETHRLMREPHKAAVKSETASESLIVEILSESELSERYQRIKSLFPRAKQLADQAKKFPQNPKSLAFWLWFVMWDSGEINEMDKDVWAVLADLS